MIRTSSYESQAWTFETVTPRSRGKGAIWMGYTNLVRGEHICEPPFPSGAHTTPHSTPPNHNLVETGGTSRLGEETGQDVCRASSPSLVRPPRPPSNGAPISCFSSIPGGFHRACVPTRGANRGLRLDLRICCRGHAFLACYVQVRPACFGKG